MSTVRIPHWFQGPTGSGQGGWSSARFVDIIGQPATVGIRAPIPLDTDLEVVETEDGWDLLDPTTDRPTLIMQAARWDPVFADTPAITIEQAVAGHSAFPLTPLDHPVPHCFSCGVQHDSMGVQAGPLGDGRYTTSWSAPKWAIGADGKVDGAVLWAALDCTAAWYVGLEGGTRESFTVQFAVEVAHAVEPNETYAIVGWNGLGPSGWDGRKRTGASAAFKSDGTCIARASSFWVAVD